ncbi:MAG: adenine phosphoribosyltransferase [Planctomycetota bacterium]
MSSPTHDRVRSLIRDIPDFPKPGILFKDIGPLLRDGRAFASTIDLLAARFTEDGVQYVAAPEARGFIFGAALACRFGCGFLPIRKPNKLPAATTSVTYDLEYGSDTVQIHSDSVHPGDRVLLVDDVLATGGTMAACARLVGSLGGIVVGCGFLMELRFLEGRGRLRDFRVEALLDY